MILVDQGDKKVYSDTKILEEEMLTIATQYPEDLSQDYIALDSRYTVNNTFSSVRRNLLNWYTFKESASVLEVGAGMGALTGLLCDNCSRVVSLEMSKKRADVIAKRYPKRKNLAIITDDIYTWQCNEKFDYIVIVGVLEYAGIFNSSENPYALFIENLKRFLKDDGIILLAIENRFGLKYWCGAAEDHICKPFAGIRGYLEKGTARTFSKKELQTLFDNAGFSYTDFFYVLPDYKFPTTIYTDDYTPSMSAIQKTAFSYVKNSSLIYNEISLYKDIFENNVGGFFANSFLIEASRKPKSKLQPIYVSSRGECRKEFRVSTFIYKTGDVVKAAMHPLAKKHINDIFENQKRLQTRGISILPSKLENHSMISSFYEGQSAEDYFHILLSSNDFNSIRELITLLKIELEKSSVCLMSSGTEECSKFYNNLYGEGKILTEGFIDMTFSNSFYKNKRLIFYDQEWCFENVPLNFILFYAIRQSYISYVGTTTIALNDIFDEFSITPYIENYINLERTFWEQILYRQEHLYDADGWYNQYSSEITLENVHKAEICRLNDVYCTLDKEVKEKNKYINHLEGELKNKIIEISKKQGYIESLEKTLKKKNNYISNLEKECESLQEWGKRLQKSFNLFTVEINKKDSYIVTLEADISKKNSRVKCLENNVASTLRQMQQKDIETKKKNDHIQSIEAQIYEKNIYIQNLEAVLNEKNEYLAKLESLLAAEGSDR